MSETTGVQQPKTEQSEAPRERAQDADETPTLAKLAEALAKAQGQFRPARKDSTNPHFGSSYADLAAVWDACRGPLSANGLSVTQRVQLVTNGVQVTTRLMHASGEWMQDRLRLPAAQMTAQGIGSAITYARRYALAAIVGVAADEDDDGNAESGRDTPPAATSKANGSSRTEQVAKEVAAKRAASTTSPRVVDVRDGETEEAATARAAQQAIWPRLVAFAKERGLTEEKLRLVAKGVLGGSGVKPAEMTVAHATMVEDAIAIVLKERTQAVAP